MNTSTMSNEYGWFYDLECPPDHAAVEYHRVKHASAREIAYRVRYNRLLVAPAKPLNDEFVLTECTVPSPDTPYIIEIPEPDWKTEPMPIPIQNNHKRDERTWNARFQDIGSLVAGMVCYGVISA